MDGEISTDEVKELLESDADVRVVDVRDRPRFEQSHIPDSVNIPFQELMWRTEEFADADRVVTVCPHGEASIEAAEFIASADEIEDLRIESMAGGLEEYGMKYGLVKEADDEDGDGDDEDEDVEAPF